MSEISLTTLMCVAPDAVERAQRLQFAIDQLRSNTREQEVRKRLQAMYSCSRVTAWRTVDMARDIA